MYVHVTALLVFSRSSQLFPSLHESTQSFSTTLVVTLLLSNKKCSSIYNKKTFRDTVLKCKVSLRTGQKDQWVHQKTAGGWSCNYNRGEGEKSWTRDYNDRAEQCNIRIRPSTVEKYMQFKWGRSDCRNSFHCTVWLLPAPPQVCVLTLCWRSLWISCFSSDKSFHRLFWQCLFLAAVHLRNSWTVSP